MLPSIFGSSLFDDWFDFPAFPALREVDRKLYGRRAAYEMKTDIREQEDHYEVDVDLPGFKKDELKLDLENGYLSISAGKERNEEATDKQGKIIRQERYCGTLQRSFYVGEQLTENDISAKFENGVLSLSIPKKDTPKLPERKTILIE